MGNSNSKADATDWTRLLSDPDLGKHISQLLNVYREAEPKHRDQALMDAIRAIKQRAAVAAGQNAPSPETPHPQPLPAPPESVPPFQPSIFTPSFGQDRRCYPRLKCYVAVELQLENSPAPIWGNLSNTSLGGCFVETINPIPSGTTVHIGLWLSTGKIWVKGVALNGVVINSTPSFGVRVRFADLGLAERETLRQFLQFIEGTTKDRSGAQAYLAELKR
jgi:hypothetical protein